MSLPDLNLLITLDVLLTEGNVTRAALRLRLSPSAMSRSLARLLKQRVIHYWCALDAVLCLPPERLNCAKRSASSWWMRKPSCGLKGHLS